MGKKRSETGTNLDRRGFVKTIAAAGLAAPFVDVPIAAAQQQQPPQTPQRVTKEMLHAAEQLIGVELNDAQEAMALRGVNQNLSATRRCARSRSRSTRSRLLRFIPRCRERNRAASRRQSSNRPNRKSRNTTRLKKRHS